jgi:cyclase
MRKIILYVWSWASIAGLAPAAAFCATDSELIKLHDSVYARIVSPDGNAVANAGFVVLDESVLVFDTHFTPEAGAELWKTIRSITPKPIRYVINSHGHSDHTHGNQAFGDAHLISSANARRDVMQIDIPSRDRTLAIAQNQLRKLRQESKKTADASQAARLREQIKAREEYLQTISKLRILAPSVILHDSLTIQDEKQEARIIYLGAGHTDGDIALFLPALKIAFVGDLLFNKAIPNVQDGNILEWMKTLQEVARLNAEKFVPGHGPIGTKKDVEDFLVYFEDLKQRVQAALDRGDSLEQATQQIQVPDKYSSYQFQNLFPANIQKMYVELKAQQQAMAPATEPPAADPGKLEKRP